MDVKFEIVEGKLSAVVNVATTPDTFKKLISGKLSTRIHNIEKELRVKCRTYAENMCHVIVSTEEPVDPISFTDIARKKALDFIKAVIDLDIPEEKTKRDIHQEAMDLIKQEQTTAEKMKIAFCKEIMEGKTQDGKKSELIDVIMMIQHEELLFPSLSALDKNFFKELCASYLCIKEPDVDENGNSVI